MKCGKWRRAIGLIAAASLICSGFAGCSKGGAGSSENDAQPAGDQAAGRFLEEELDTGVKFKDIYDVRRQEDGSLRIVGMEEDAGDPGVWESTDAGVTWKRLYNLPTLVQDGAIGWWNDAAVSPGGQIVGVRIEMASDGSSARSGLYLVDREGKAEKMPFELPGEEDGGKKASAGDAKQQESGGNDIMNLQFPGNDWVVVQDRTGTVYQINVSDGSVKHTYGLNSYMSAFPLYVVGNTLIAQGNEQVLCYDLLTGEQRSSEEILNQVYSENGPFSAVDTLDGGESIYALSGDGLYRYKFGGSVMEHIIDGSVNTLGAPAFFPIALAMVDEQNLLVAANDINASSGTGVCVMKYTYAADTPAKPDKELKLYSLYDSAAIRQCISRFQKERSDVCINFQPALSEDNGVTVSDALKTLTTEIMVGNGPDVLILDGMPVEAYIEKGVLKELGALQIEGGSYFDNILNAYSGAEGQRYALPARFKIPMIQAGSKYFSPGEDFNAFMERKDTMVNMLPNEVVEKFWYVCGASWQKEDKTLDESKVAEFLTKLKNAYGEYDANVENNRISLVTTDRQEGTEIVSDIDFSMGNMNLAFGKCNTNFGLYKEMDYGMHKAINEKLEDGNMDLMPGQASHVFVPALVLGVSSKGRQPEIAEEFVKYLFSQEAQKIKQFGGFPVEKESFCEMIDGHQYEGKDSTYSITVGGEIFKYYKAPTPQEEITKLTELVESLTTPSLQDDVIKEVVVEQGEKVLKGEQSPEEGAAAIMRKVNIYLAE